MSLATTPPHTGVFRGLSCNETKQYQILFRKRQLKKLCGKQSCQTSCTYEVFQPKSQSERLLGVPTDTH